MTIEIIPAIMPFSYNDLCKKLEAVNYFSKNIQIDIMDGIFVPSRSWPFNNGSFNDHIPRASDEKIELDLMVNNPLFNVEKWLNFNPARIVFHWGSFRPDQFDQIEKLRDEHKIEVGLAIHTDHNIHDLSHLFSKIDFVQCMGISKPGFQGQPFDEESIKKIMAVRVLDEKIPIQVDGSVNLKTIERLVHAGANRLVCGSTIFESENPRKTFEEVKDFANSVL